MTWFDHDGHTWPEHAHPEDRVEVQYRFGGHHIDTVAAIWRLDGWKYEGFPDESDIIKYRLLSPLDTVSRHGTL